jgi:molecular chaperone GrpE
MAEQTHEHSSDIPGAEPAVGDSSVDSAAELRRELEELRARADDHYRSWQRSAADFSNFKRRIDEEKRYAERWLLQDLLPILDDFDRAWASLPVELRRLSWIEGVFQINSKLYGVLQQHGITPVEAAGKAFNPLEHEAVLREENEDPAEQTSVVAELQRGYRYHDRVLRAALVKVGKPRSKGQDDAEVADPAVGDAS